MSIATSPPPTRPAVAASTASPAGIAAFCVERLRASRVLQACALLAFLEYGALAFFAIFGARLRPTQWNDGRSFQLAGWLALCSLGSWFCIFAWFPFLRQLQAAEGASNDAGGAGGSAAWMGRILEAFAIACVAVVHGLMAYILVLAVR